MQRSLKSVLLLGCALVGLSTIGLVSAWAVSPAESSTSADYFRMLMGNIAGDDWGKYGGLFTLLQGQGYFLKAFLLLITAIPLVFALHYLVIGAKHFDHGGKQILFFPLFARIVHFIGALSFSTMVLTGLLIVSGAFFGGGGLIRLARLVHLIAAIAFVPAAFCMLIIWFKDMLPALHDIKWCLILGGYLSKEKKPVPAAKFNAGQKMWYWCAVPGGALMAFTGFYIWGFAAPTDLLRIYIMIHNVMGMILVAFYLTHAYMSIFAIAGSLESMKTGYKPEEEVAILHSLHKYQ